MTLNDVLRGLDRSGVGLTLLSGPPFFVSYEELGARIRGNANHLRALGIAKGDRVAIALETKLEHVVVFLALVAIGAIPVSIKPRRGSVEEHTRYVEKLVRRYGVRFLHHDLPQPRSSETREHASPSPRSFAWDPDARSDDRSAIAEVDPEDIAFVQFSSGSLGDPKAIPIRHASLIANIEAILEVDRRDADTIGYTFLPLSHDMGLVGGLLSNLFYENPLYLSPVQEFIKRPTDFFSRFDSMPRVVCPMPDFALRYLVRFIEARKERVDRRLLRCLETVYCGAEPIRRSTIEKLLAIAPHVSFDPRALVFSYGMAESTLMTTAHRFESLARSFHKGHANVGAPIKNHEIDVRAGGAIFVRGASVFRGYLDEAPLGDGWHDTGDIGFSANGALHISGRAKDMVIVNGENLFPTDIEELAARIPGVGESLAMADDDRFYLYVVTKDGKRPDESAIAARIGAELGAVPAAIAFGPKGNIVRTTSGKPIRRATLVDLRRRGALP